MRFQRRFAVVVPLIVLVLIAARYRDTRSGLPQSAIVPDGGTYPVALIVEPDDGLAPIIALLRSASSSVDIVMYEFEDGDVERVLAEGAARGVAVRVLLNEGYYGKKENDKNNDAYWFLSMHGVAVKWTPAYFALTHQKTIVIDGRTAIIMTMNFTPQYYATSRDFAVVNHDAADVSAVEDAFDADWRGIERGAEASSDLVWSPGAKGALLALIASARTSLDVYNEEMADSDITHVLGEAARRGVSVRVVMTYNKHWRRAFEELTNAGVGVHTYDPHAARYIHAKAILADGARAFIGSENFSRNSMLKNRELGLIVIDPTVLARLVKTFESDWAGAHVFVPSN